MEDGKVDFLRFEEGSRSSFPKAPIPINRVLWMNEEFEKKRKEAREIYLNTWMRRAEFREINLWCDDISEAEI